MSGGMVDVHANTIPAVEETGAITERFPAVAPPRVVLGGGAGRPEAPRSPAAVSLGLFPRTRTAPMPARPVDPAGLVVFPGERLSRLDDFVRLAIASRRVTFLSVLDREGLDPAYYRDMTRRLEALMRQVPAIAREYERLMRGAASSAA